MDTEARLQAIDRATLTPLVRQSLGSDTVEVTDWRYQALPAERRNVFRVAGNGCGDGETVTWSLVVKVVGRRPWETREARSYQSGLLADLPVGIVAPRCFGVEEHGGKFWIWLEEVTDEIGEPWPLDRYGLAARHLGQFTGAYLAGRSLPNEPWLSRGWLRDEVGGYALDTAQLRNLPDHPLLRRAFPDRSVDDLLRLWEERGMFLDALDQLPKTFGHLDTAPSNVFARRDANGREQTVAIDWSCSGAAEIGHEIAPLVFFSLLGSRVDIAEAKELDERVFAGYVSGLQEAGWQDDPCLVRFGYAASLALRYGPLCGRRLLRYGLDESGQTWVEQVGGRPTGEVLDHFAAVHRFLLDRADEARQLLDVVR